MSVGHSTTPPCKHWLNRTQCLKPCSVAGWKSSQTVKVSFGEVHGLMTSLYCPFASLLIIGPSLQVGFWLIAVGNTLEQSLTTWETEQCRCLTVDGKQRSFSLRPSTTLSRASLMNVQLPCRYQPLQVSLSIFNQKVITKIWLFFFSKIRSSQSWDLIFCYWSLIFFAEITKVAFINNFNGLYFYNYFICYPFPRGGLPPNFIFIWYANAAFSVYTFFHISVLE